MPLFAPNIEKLKSRRDVRALVKLLETHRSPEVRLAAARALGEIGDREGVEPLLRTLDAADGKLRLVVIAALARLGDRRAIEPLIGVLQSGDPDARPYAIRALALLRATPAADALIAIRESDPANRRPAIQALVALNDTRAVAPLTHCETSPDVVQATRAALIDLGAAAIPALLSAVNTTDDPRLLIDVLAAIGAPAVDPLMRASREGADRIRRAAAGALARIGEPALGPLITELDSSQGSSRCNEMAAWALGEMGDPRAVEPLSAALRTTQRTNRLFRRELIQALGRIGSDAALPAFRLALRDDDADLRRAAVNALAGYGHAEATSLLRGALQDADPGVCAEAARALGRRGDVTVVEDLGKKLRDANPDMGRAAAQALVSIGGPQAMALLNAALRDPRCAIRTQIAAAWLDDGSTAALRALSVLTADAHAGIRWMALRARARLEGSAAIPALITALQDADADVRSVAAEALDGLNWRPERDEQKARYLVARQRWDETVALGQAASAALRDVLSDERVRVPAGTALETLGWQPAAQDAAAADFWIERHQWDRCVEIGLPAVAPLLVALHRLDPAARLQAVRALGRIGDEQAMQGLADLLNDPGQEIQVQQEAARALGQIGGTAAGRALTTALRQTATPRLALEIIATLSMLAPSIPTTTLLSALLEHLDHPDLDVQQAARRAADALCGPEALPGLIQALGHRRRPVRQYAAQALIALYRSGQLDAAATQTMRNLHPQITAPHTDRGENRSHEDEMRTVEGWCVAHVDEAAQTHTDAGIGLSFDL
ncbi:MAG TPA: HEAT repeat domain-containing protein [Anaerolineae bacterium]|nr:HEAT repeat domain-containing protein [Anaerolineae bacterium]HQH39540.1 HEAT repeat domain-containing protein [Anaerolineae bacterium]